MPFFLQENADHHFDKLMVMFNIISLTFRNFGMDQIDVLQDLKNLELIENTQHTNLSELSPMQVFNVIFPAVVIDVSRCFILLPQQTELIIKLR